jgi:acetolactate synthase-1/2/3 large subunit
VSDGPPPTLATGAITPENLGASLAALLPENAIVVDEAVTTGRGFFAPTRLAPPHDWLSNMGGSIGMGMPVATGAAVACPDRKVVCLEGDGSGMYTLQALWTQAREGLDVTTLLFSNRSYAILKGELANVGAGNPGRKALDMLDLGHPDLDWVGLARSMGVPGAKARRWKRSTTAWPKGSPPRARSSSRSSCRAHAPSDHLTAATAWRRECDGSRRYCAP